MNNQWLCLFSGRKLCCVLWWVPFTSFTFIYLVACVIRSNLLVFAFLLICYSRNSNHKYLMLENSSMSKSLCFLRCQSKIMTLTAMVLSLKLVCVSYRLVCGELVLQLAKRQMQHCQISLSRWTQAFCLSKWGQNASLVLSLLTFLPFAEHSSRKIIREKGAFLHPFNND